MEEIYSFPTQGRAILKGLDEFRIRGQLCDGIFKTSDGKVFPVHRAILAAASEYFSAMFCGGFKEAKNNNTPIVLQNITALGLGTILSCIYSDSLVLTTKNVFEVLPVAHICCFENIVSSCGEFMVKHLSIETCFAALELSNRFSMLDLEEKTENFMRENFVKLSTTKDFLDIPCDVLCRFLQDDNLVGVEIEIFQAARRWLEASSDRSDLSVEVMSLINFKSIPPEKLADEVINADVFKTSGKCLEMVLQAIKYQMNVYSQPLNKPERIRGVSKIVVIEEAESIGDMYTTTKPGEMRMYEKGYLENVSENYDVPCKAQNMDVKLIEKSMNSVVVGNFLFLFGIRSDDFKPVSMRFDGTMKTWIDLAPIPRPAAVATVAGLVREKDILAVGGMFVTKKSEQKRDGSKFDMTVYRYILRSNCWEKVQNFPSRIAYASACTSQGTLYVAGGVVPRGKKKFSSSAEVMTWSKLYAFDNNADIWLSKAPMNNARSEAVLKL